MSVCLFYASETVETGPLVSDKWECLEAVSFTNRSAPKRNELTLYCFYMFGTYAEFAPTSVLPL